MQLRVWQNYKHYVYLNTYTQLIDVLASFLDLLYIQGASSS